MQLGINMHNKVYNEIDDKIEDIRMKLINQFEDEMKAMQYKYNQKAQELYSQKLKNLDSFINTNILTDSKIETEIQFLIGIGYGIDDYNITNAVTIKITNNKNQEVEISVLLNSIMCPEHIGYYLNEKLNKIEFDTIIIPKLSTLLFEGLKNIVENSF